MPKYVVKFTKESYVEIEAESKDAAHEYLNDPGLDITDIEKGSDGWELDSVYLAEDY